uniref:Uncharacterized protein n=1 Tax=Arundo donax TaxID=35708 RepID=A0A0A9H427_ARUDO
MARANESTHRILPK